MNSSRYDKIEIVEFCSGTDKEIDLLSKLTMSESVAFIALSTDTDMLYAIACDGKEVIDGLYRKLILSGMFPSITGVIQPEFKIIRTNISTILAKVANS